MQRKSNRPKSPSDVSTKQRLREVAVKMKWNIWAEDEVSFFAKKGERAFKLNCNPSGRIHSIKLTAEGRKMVFRSKPRNGKTLRQQALDWLTTFGWPEDTYSDQLKYPKKSGKPKPIVTKIIPYNTHEPRAH